MGAIGRKTYPIGKRLGVELPIGFGAKPPTLRQLYALKARGFYNIVRDIFKKGLTKEKRIQLISDIAPDLAPDVARLLEKESAIANLEKLLKSQEARAYLGTAREGGAKGLALAIRAVLRGENPFKYLRQAIKKQPTLIRQKKQAMAEITTMKRMAQEAKASERLLYTQLAKRLGIELQARAAFMNRLMVMLPKTYGINASRQYNELLAAMKGRVAVTARKRVSIPAKVGRPRIPEKERIARPTERIRLPGEPPRVPALIKPSPARPVRPVEPARPARPTRPERPLPPVRTTRPVIPEKPFRPVKTKPVPPRVPRRLVPDIPKKQPPPPTLLRPRVAEDKRKKIPDGSITWYQGELRQGPVWKYIAPPWTGKKTRTLFAPPIGAVKTGNKTARGTIQMIGTPDARVPEKVSLDLGFVDAFISEYGRKIDFTGKGEKTDVGGRMESPTKGMSIPGEAYPGMPVTGEREVVVRAIKKKATRNKKRDEYASILMPRGGKL